MEKRKHEGGVLRTREFSNLPKNGLRIIIALARKTQTSINLKIKVK